MRCSTEDHDLTKLDEAEIATLGVGRKFQKPTVFENHTVEDNLVLATKAPRGVFATLFGREDNAIRERIDVILATTRLAELRERIAGSLSHGQKQWLEIGMLLAQDPKLLLVDEPVAGMTDAETAATAELLREIARDHSVVVVEHDMAFVRELGVKVTVLHEGSVLAEGTLDQVSADPRVVEVYLGRSLRMNEAARTPSPGCRASGEGSRRRCGEVTGDRHEGVGTLHDPGRPMLSVERIDLFYGAAQALRGVSVKAETGRILCVLGRNGVGKSSLLRAIVGQHMIASGAIRWNGEDMSSAAEPSAREGRLRLRARRGARSSRSSPCARI